MAQNKHWYLISITGNELITYWSVYLWTKIPGMNHGVRTIILWYSWKESFVWDESFKLILLIQCLPLCLFSTPLYYQLSIYMKNVPYVLLCAPLAVVNCSKSHLPASCTSKCHWMHTQQRYSVISFLFSWFQLHTEYWDYKKDMISLLKCLQPPVDWNGFPYSTSKMQHFTALLNTAVELLIKY